MNAFSGDTFLRDEIKRLLAKHDIQTIIETGTFRGETTLAFASMVPNVHTIENSYQFASIARRKFDRRTNICLHIGNSPECLRRLLPKIKTPSLFFLDAHWYNYFPLLDELRVIAMHPQTARVIVIHDFFVPHTNLGYDSYIQPSSSLALDFVRSSVDMLIRPLSPRLSRRLLSKQRLDFDYIQNHIVNINPAYNIHYNGNAVGKKRGVIFIEMPICT